MILIAVIKLENIRFGARYQLQAENESLKRLDSLRCQTHISWPPKKERREKIVNISTVPDSSLSNPRSGN